MPRSPTKPRAARAGMPPLARALPVRASAWLAACAWLVASLWLFAPALAHAQHGDYPSRTVKIIVSAPAGGGLDLAARIIAEKLRQVLGQPFIVENRPGAA